MRCPHCTSDNPAQNIHCDICGNELTAKRSTVLENASPEQPQGPIPPGKKRPTLYEPDEPPQTLQSGGGGFPPPYAPRPPINPHNPFEPIAATRPVPASSPQVAAAAPAPRSPRSPTIIDISDGNAPLRIIRGALFEYRNSHDAGRVYPLLAGRNLIGRNPDCDVVLENERVSGNHAYLMIRAEDATFMDVSSNGSVVNGAVVSGEQVVLTNNAVLKLGGTTLVFVIIPEQVLARPAR